MVCFVPGAPTRGLRRNDLAGNEARSPPKSAKRPHPDDKWRRSDTVERNALSAFSSHLERKKHAVVIIVG